MPPDRRGAARRWLGRAARRSTPSRPGQRDRVDRVAFGARGGLPGVLAGRQARRVQLLRWVGHGRRRHAQRGQGVPRGDGLRPDDEHVLELPHPLHARQAGTAVWPSFLPTNDAVVFELETMNNGRDWGGTRSTCDSSATCSNSGTQAELWWVDLATKTAARLDSPQRPGLPADATATNHTNDATLNYEPTVNPVRAGGYAWVVFTSRRLYGNVATHQPVLERPALPRHQRDTHARRSSGSPRSISTRSPAPTRATRPSTCPRRSSSPATRAATGWSIRARQNGSTCETGDQCCGGYCEDSDGGLVCSEPAPGVLEHRRQVHDASDCCGVGRASSASTASARSRRRCNAGHARERWA